MSEYIEYYNNERINTKRKGLSPLEQLKAAMSEYIEYYNNERINTKRKGLSPLAYRQQSFQDLALI